MVTELIDISPKVSTRIGVWPGDSAYRRIVHLDLEKGDNIGLSRIETTTHLGAHADAPNHYRAGLCGIDERDLSFYFGECQVVSVLLDRGQRIGPQHVREKIRATRILFRTLSFPDPEHWNADFCSLSAGLVHWLSEQGVRLVGIDTPSIDLQDDPLLESHQAVADHDMAILEGLVLEHVDPGNYTLVAMPLRLEGADASPVRAVLIRDPRRRENGSGRR